jgi:anti-sigma factor RsiW
MNKISQQMEESIFNYLDGSLSDSERKELEVQLNQDDVLRTRFEELQAVHVFINELKIEQPSGNFTSVVMSNLDQVPDTTTRAFSLNSILLLAGILMAVGIASLLVSAGVFDGAAVVDLNNVDLTQKYFKFSIPTFIIQSKLIVNIIIFLNVALALIVLDRSVLKPFFRRRMQM